MIESIALGLAALAMPLQTAPAQDCTVSPQPGRCIEGSWTGPFLQYDWTLEFKQDGGVWSGRYRTSKTNLWHPLQSLAVSGGALSFGIESTPQVTFALKLDASARTLAGEVRVADHPSLPFSATRGS